MQINSNRKNRSREDLQKVMTEEANNHGTIEQFFAEDQMARLETKIPNKIKRDLSELTSCIDTKGTGSTRAANRIIVEALADVFAKYKAGNGEFNLNDEPSFRGEYTK